MRATLRSYAAQVGVALRVSAADRVNFAVQVVGMLINDGFVLLLWFMFFQGFKSIGGWRLGDVALLVGILTCVCGVSGVVFGGYRDMAAAILRGEPDALLTQPKPVYLRLLARESIVIGWGDVITGIVLMTAFSGLKPAQAPFALLMVASGVAIFVAASTTFACLAFWARGARSFARDLTDFVVLFCSYPGSMYAGAWRIVVYTVLPAGFIVLTPVAFLRHPSPELAGLMVAAVIGYWALALAVFRLGLARYRRGETPAALD